MNKDTKLFIYEIRTGHPQNLARFEQEPPASYLGKELAASLYGHHLEADFLFLFFGKHVDLGNFLGRYPAMELREVHEMTYDQWQDGAESPPMAVGPLLIRPVFGLAPGGAWGSDSGAEAWAGTEGAEAPEAQGATEAKSGVGTGTEPGKKSSVSEILIDPGLAFGFGGHPTTMACLGFLVRLYKPGTTVSPSPETALDLGCGTGVLGLAAARLGAREVLGLDHSYLAVDAANLNAKMNNLGDIVKVKRGLAQEYAQYPANLVMANIPLMVLSELVDLGAFSGRDYAIVSGLLPQEGETFLELLAKKINYRVLDSLRSDRWMSYLIKPTG
jgi:ribosomal protein L11 methylase PrmA